MFFVEPPEDFSPQFTTVVGLVEHDGRLLVVQRQAQALYGGYWGLPGGKQDRGESLSETVARELSEETGITLDPTALTIVFSRATRYPEFDFWFHMARATVPEQPTVTLDPVELAAFRWVTPREALALDHLPNFDTQIRAAYSLE